MTQRERAEECALESVHVCTTVENFLAQKRSRSLREKKRTRKKERKKKKFRRPPIYDPEKQLGRAPGNKNSVAASASGRTTSSSSSDSQAYTLRLRRTARKRSKRQTVTRNILINTPAHRDVSAHRKFRTIPLSDLVIAFILSITWAIGQKKQNWKIKDCVDGLWSGNICHGFWKEKKNFRRSASPFFISGILLIKCEPCRTVHFAPVFA